MNTIHIAFAVNNNYAKHLGATLLSFLEHHQEEQVVAHVLYKDLSPLLLEDLEHFASSQETLELVLHQIKSSDFLGIPVRTEQFPIESFFRFLLPELLPQVNRLLYLDVDILIKGNVRQLFEQDLQGYELAAVRESDIYAYYQWYLDTLGFTAEDAYFSSGVLLMDLALMRERDTARKLLSMAMEQAATLKFPDQDILNQYYKGDFVQLSSAYNYTDYRKKIAELSPHEVIIEHFNGDIKPWHALSKVREDLQDSVLQYQEYQARYRRFLHNPQITLLLTVGAYSECLRECLESLAEQSYLGVQIYGLLDKPDDETTQLLKLYEADSRFSFHPAAALPSLLKAEKLGHAFGFVSPDSKIDPAYVEKLWQSMEEHRVDMAVTTFAVLRQQKGVFMIYPEEFLAGQVFSTKNLLENLYQHTWFEENVHKGLFGKLYRTSVLERIHVQTDVECLALALYLQAEKLVIGCERLYMKRYYGEDETQLENADDVYLRCQEWEKYRSFMVENDCQTTLFDARQPHRLAQVRQLAQVFEDRKLVDEISLAIETANRIVRKG